MASKEIKKNGKIETIEVNVRRPFLEQQEAETRIYKGQRKLYNEAGSSKLCAIPTVDSSLADKSEKRLKYRFQSKSPSSIKRANSIVKADIHKQLPVVEELDEL